ncbi:uncharacterized protein N7518_006069 [Penicillium psychrosexuale]|uniref:uncharacterized protein n=1 Tax=Penicillium psychrosexuale TaxID=1002107 RepID=UPI0025459985|nr:uncharacterized protein N7518_006069 [Penicillium psychrosexuale]KAJ5789058.1 hypothetical protein N7518_006069 [Penicillium psychrosexuale]
MACGCERRIARRKYQNCTATPKHEKEEIAMVQCPQPGGSNCTGYKDVYLATSVVRVPGHICPKC